MVWQVSACVLLIASVYASCSTCRTGEDANALLQTKATVVMEKRLQEEAVGTSTEEDHIQAGWQSADAQIVRNAPCNIDIREARDLSLAEFKRAYENKRPLLVRGATANWSAHRVWTKRFLQSRFGHKKVWPEAGAMLMSQGNFKPGEPMTFSAYLKDFSHHHDYDHDYHHCYDQDCDQHEQHDDDHHTALYIFGSLKRIMGSRGVDELGPLQYALDWVPEINFAVGQNSSGLNFHHHNEAWNACIWGSRRWFVEHSDCGHAHEDGNSDSSIANAACEPLGNMNMPSSRWLEFVYPALNKSRVALSECMQRKGDLIYVPQGLNHAVVNYGDSVAVQWHRMCTPRDCPSPTSR